MIYSNIIRIGIGWSILWFIIIFKNSSDQIPSEITLEFKYSLQPQISYISDNPGKLIIKDNELAIFDYEKIIGLFTNSYIEKTGKKYISINSMQLY